MASCRASRSSSAKSTAAAPRPRSSSAMAVATPASTSAARRRSRRRRSRIRCYETTFEIIVPLAMTKERIAETTAAYVAAARAGRGGGLRLRRDPRRARLSHLAVPCAVRKPPHRRIRRQPGEPRPLRPRCAARGQGRSAAARRHLPAVGRRLFRGRADLWRRSRDRDLGRAGRCRRAACHRRPLPLAADRAPHDPADDRAGCDVPCVRGRREAGDQGTGDRGRSARRSRDRDARGRRAARPTSWRSGARCIADPQWVEKLRREEPIRRCLACNTCINEMRGGAGIGCVVNGAAGRETLFVDAAPPRDERIAVIGAGPGGADLRLARRRPQCGDRLREKRPRWRRPPLRRQGAAVPGGCGERGKPCALHRRAGGGVHREGCGLPHTHQRRTRPGSCSCRSTAS